MTEPYTPACPLCGKEPFASCCIHCDWLACRNTACALHFSPSRDHGWSLPITDGKHRVVTSADFAT